MKKSSFAVIFGLALLMSIYSLSTLSTATTVDFRESRPRTHPVFRIEVPRITVASASTSGDVCLKLNGTIRQITIGIATNTNDKLATVSIISDEGSILFTSIAIVTSTVLSPTVQQFMTLSSTDLPLAILVTGVVSITADYTSAPGTSTGFVDVTLFGD